MKGEKIQDYRYTIHPMPSRLASHCSVNNIENQKGHTTSRTPRRAEYSYNFGEGGSAGEALGNFTLICAIGKQNAISSHSRAIVDD
jgi:hypothetical protein